MDGDRLILADDLTGAADCAIAFAHRGATAIVGWGEHRRGDYPHVLSYDCDSRGLPAAAAAERQRDALHRLLDPGTLLFKKIDSTLRGQPAAEVAACVAGLRARFGRAFAIVAPAFPATRRTTVGGHVHVAGRALERTEVWRRDHTYASADLVAVLASAGLGGEVLPLSLVRGGSGPLRDAFASLMARGDVVAICDAESHDDLERIARASHPSAPWTLHVGSAGLAHAVAAVACGTPKAGVPKVGAPAALPMPRRGGTLLVVGTLAAVSRAAARRMAAAGDVRHVPLPPALLLGPEAAWEPVVATLAEALGAGGDVMVEIAVGDAPDLSIGPRLVEALARLLRPVLPLVGALAATGGETAAALLTRFGVDGIHLHAEIEPGVCLGLTLGAVSIPVVTKAGAFGDEDSLNRIAARLRHIRGSTP